MELEHQNETFRCNLLAMTASINNACIGDRPNRSSNHTLALNCACLGLIYQNQELQRKRDAEREEYKAAREQNKQRGKNEARNC